MESHRKHRILHIAESPPGESAAMTSALRDLGGEVEVRGDVYSGLARLGRSGSERIDAVVLGLDWLGRGEYAFIAEVNRCACGVPVFVHADPPAQGRISKALALGARGAINASRESVGVVLEKHTDVAQADDGDSAQEQVTVRSEPTDGGHSDRVPVPWRDDERRPTRTAPERGSLGGEQGLTAGPGRMEASERSTTASTAGPIASDELASVTTAGPEAVGDRTVSGGKASVPGDVTGVASEVSEAPGPPAVSGGPLLTAEEIELLLYGDEATEGSSAKMKGAGR